MTADETGQFLERDLRNLVRPGWRHRPLPSGSVGAARAGSRGLFSTSLEFT